MPGKWQIQSRACTRRMMGRCMDAWVHASWQGGEESRYLSSQRLEWLEWRLGAFVTP